MTIAVVILTLNEELNLPKALASVAGRCAVIVVDSGSRDRTQAIARDAGAEVVEHPFVDYASQRNWALDRAAERFDWVFFLDADEELTPRLWQEIEDATSRPDVDGAYVRFDLRLLGRQIVRGEFGGSMVLRLMRTGGARFDRGINERVDDRGLRVILLRERLIHRDAKPLAEWFKKHVEYARREALAYVDRLDRPQTLQEINLRTKAGRVAVMRRIYNRLPLFARPFLNYGRVMLLQGAWRDGAAGLLYAAMHALWYQLVVDLLIHEELLRRSGALDREYAPRWGGEDP